MTTPIERAAEAITASRPHSGGGSQIIYEDAEDYARAAFESIDRDELADVIYPEIRLSPDHRPSEMVRALHTADAIIAYLTGDQS